MPTITLKNIPNDIYEMVKQSAAANRRSINSEIITFIERGVRSRPVDAEASITQARALRRKTRDHPITEIAFETAKRRGRP